MSEPIIKMTGGVIRQQKNTILKNVNIEIQSGEFVYLIGKVGSGKSSFLKTLYAELPLEYGNAEVAGFQLKKIKKSQIPLLRRKCGIVFQDFKLLIDRSVYANLEFVLKATGWKNKKDIRERIETVLEKVGMSDKKHKMPHQLSGGEQQRIVLARALLNAPPLILADEPTGNIDPETSYKLVELLKEICETGKTIIIATHQYDLIEKYPGRILCCDNGSLFEKSSLTAEELEEKTDIPEDQEQSMESSSDSDLTPPAEIPVEETNDSSIPQTEIHRPEPAPLASEQLLQTEPEEETEKNIQQENISGESNPEKKASGENTLKENTPEESTLEENVSEKNTMQISEEQEKISEPAKMTEQTEQLEEQTEDLSALIGELSFPEITAFDYEIAESPVYEAYSIEKALQEEILTSETSDTAVPPENTIGSSAQTTDTSGISQQEATLITDSDLAQEKTDEIQKIKEPDQTDGLTAPVAETGKATASKESDTEKTKTDSISQPTETEKTESTTETEEPKKTEKSEQKPAPPVFDLELSDL